jgi:uncharacterized protein YndB with AHSA1/START domain
MEPVRSPVAETGMLIRRPTAEVFEAFVDPSITSKFWFTGGSDRLDAGKEVRWDWEMYDAHATVDVKTIEKDKRIVVEWSAYGAPTTIEWTFTPYERDSTFVRIRNSGFSGSETEKTQQAISSTEGFTLVLAGLKALLEHSIRLNLVPDRFPKGLPEE